MRKYLIISEGKTFTNSEPIIATANQRVVNLAFRALCEYLEPKIFGMETVKGRKNQPPQAPEGSRG
jgi:hypothetical protein